MALIAALSVVVVAIGFHFSPGMSQRRRALEMLAKREHSGTISAPEESRLLNGLSRVVLRLSHGKIGSGSIDTPKFALRSWFDVEYISIDYPTDEELALLGAFSECRKLRIQFGEFSDAGLIHLQKMKNLRQLDIWCENITDQGLANLRGLDHLEKLELTFAEIQGWGFREMTCRDSLREFRIWNSTEFDDAAMLELAVFRNLETLSVAEPGVKGSGLAVIEQLPHLRFLLGFSEKNVEPEWVPLLRRVPNR